MNVLFVFALPFILSGMLAIGIRAVAGEERGARLAGVAVVLGFLVPWSLSLTPGWIPSDSLGRIGHIAGGAAMVGFVLDYFGFARLWAAIAAGVVVIVSTWASLNNGLSTDTQVSLTMALFLVLYSGLAFLLLAKLNSMRDRPAGLIVTVIMIGLAIVVQSAVVGDLDILKTGFILVVAVLAYSAVCAFVLVIFGYAFVLGTGSVLLSAAWALAERAPSTLIALLLLPLMLFAEGTAKHIKLPDARISSYLYPLVLAGVAALPLGLGAVITFVMYGP